LRWISVLTLVHAHTQGYGVRHPRSICRNASFSCVDCGVTFTGTSYREHTSCISEAEKYQKSLYNGSKNKNKGGNSATSSANGNASASPAPKAKSKPDTPRKKAYWEESTTDEDSSDDEDPASKKPAAKTAEVKTDNGSGSSSKKSEGKTDGSGKKTKGDAAAAVSGAEQQPASEADAAPAAKPKKAKRGVETAEEPTPKKARAVSEAAVEVTPDDAASEKKKKKKNKVKATEGEDGESGTATALAPLTVADLIAADQLDAAISAAALDVARARRMEELESEPFTLAAFEAAVVRRLQWGGCTVEKKELRQRVRDQLTVDLDAAGTALLLR